MPCALQSNWLTFHVLTCFFGYSGFAVSFASSIAYLIKLKKKRGQLEQPLDDAEAVLPSLDALDEITYKTVAIGFLLFSKPMAKRRNRVIFSGPWPLRI